MMSQKTHLNNSLTQIEFFECLSDDYLTELLHRIDNNKLKEDIEEELKNMRNYEKLKEYHIKTKLSLSNPYDPSIYIKYILNDIEQFHISVHFCSSSISISQSKGPMHITQNNEFKTTQKIRVNKSNVSSLHFSVGNSFIRDKHIKDIHKKLAQAALNVLTKYFKNSPDNKLHLSHKSTNWSHSLLNKYKDGRKKAIKSFNTTRKNKPSSQKRTSNKTSKINKVKN